MAVEIFTYAQWRARGLSEKALRHALASGAVWRVLKSVYADGSVTDCLATRARAIDMIRPQQTVIGRQTAAWLAGLDVLPPGRSIVDEPIRLLVPPGIAPPRLPGCRSHETPLPDADLVEQHGVISTSDARTALDLGRFCPREQAVASLDAFLHARLVTLVELWRRANTLTRVRNCRILRANLDIADSGAESYAESVLRTVYFDCGLPRSETQIEVTDRSGGLIGFLDLGWRRFRVGAEYDGEEGHDADEQQEHDERRRVAMRRGDDWSLAIARKSDLWGHRAALMKRTAELLLEAGWSPDDATLPEQITVADEFEARTGQQWHWMPTPRTGAA